MTPRQDFVFIAENLALDLVNTQRMRDGEQVDDLEDYHALVNWLVQADIVGAAQAKAALKKWGGSPQGRRAYEQACALRGALRAMAEHIVADKPTPQSSLDAINEVLRHGITYNQVSRARGKFEKHPHTTHEEAMQLIVPIADAAADLLCHGDLSLVKKCSNPRCILFFYDTTKNHARRWCSMAGCGNRMKAAAHYRRYHHPG
ncbi:MAG TPA: ABATE domain-containing protein [Gammaproteobacteria bacterium]|nr:ABATE domain-containing protein [Gammaproteobacteria bacterium]